METGLRAEGMNEMNGANPTVYDRRALILAERDKRLTAPVRGVCRLCGGPAKPPKRHWCGEACKQVGLFLLGCERYVIWKRDHGVCAECGEECDWRRYPELDDKRWDHHHVVPLSEGGEHHPDNIITLCTACHKETHAGRRGRLAQAARRQVALPLDEPKEPTP